MTLLFQKFTGDAVIFPKRLDWNGSELFDEVFVWFLSFAAVQTGSFAFILLIHFLKSKFVCKQSVEIHAFDEPERKSTVKFE